jgi:hypothetical protein
MHCHKNAVMEVTRKDAPAHLICHPSVLLGAIAIRGAIGGGVGRIMKLGFQPVNISASFYGNAVYPTGGSTWTMRLQLALLFPKLTKEQEKMMVEQKLKQMEQEQPQKK